MKKKGFTLIELLTVIIILGIILSLTVPTVLGVINNSKQKVYDSQIQNIEIAAEAYIVSNGRSISQLDEIGGIYYISLRFLNESGYIELPIKNTLTDIDFDPDNVWVRVEKTAINNYSYNFVTEYLDEEGPVVSFSTNGSGTYTKTAETIVTVSDVVGVDESSLKYLWSTSKTIPAEVDFSTTFTNGDTITKGTETGTYYNRDILFMDICKRC